MTVLIVIRTDLRQTLRWGIARIGGTMAGAAVATLVVEIVPPGQWIVAATVGLNEQPLVLHRMAVTAPGGCLALAGRGAASRREAHLMFSRLDPTTAPQVHRPH